MKNNKNEHLMFVANWKMALPFNEALAFATKHYDSFVELAQSENKKIVLCPSFDSLYPIAQFFSETNIALGAQDCSGSDKGPFTGQVSSESLQAIGCTYCIVGHSERRKFNGETNEDVAKKVEHLIAHNISPIICIGETQEEYQAGKALEVLEKQLTPVFDILPSENTVVRHLPLCIAYEPRWSIGTGKVPDQKHLEVIFSWLHAQTLKTLPHTHWKLLYGGSIREKHVKSVLSISHVSGFLIGKASLDFQEFEKIVKYNGWVEK